MISLETVNELIASEKQVIRPMKWSLKLNRADPCWYQFESGVMSTWTEEVLEGVLIRCLWRPPIGTRSGVFYAGLFAQISERIYAVDVGPLDDHTNNKGGFGRPFWGKHVGGVHEHTWSSDGCGYAEPLEGLTDQNVEVAWDLFLRRANLKYPFRFVHPDEAVDAGIGALDI